LEVFRAHHRILIELNPFHCMHRAPGIDINKS
jgi:hypothetical protein